MNKYLPRIAAKDRHRIGSFKRMRGRVVRGKKVRVQVSVKRKVDPYEEVLDQLEKEVVDG